MLRVRLVLGTRWWLGTDGHRPSPGAGEGALPAAQTGSIGIGEDDSCLRLWPEGKSGERFDVRMPGGCGSCWELGVAAPGSASPPEAALPALPRGPGLAWGKKTAEATQDQTQALNRAFGNISGTLSYAVVQDSEQGCMGVPGRGWAGVSAVPPWGQDTTESGTRG